MVGTVKWFNAQKGYGFITNDATGEEVFVHHTSIDMEGYRTLNEGDIVGFEFGEDTTGRLQAINVTPIATMQMVKTTLGKEGLSIKSFKDVYGVKKYHVVDTNNFIQNGEWGMSFDELAEYAGFKVN